MIRLTEAQKLGLKLWGVILSCGAVLFALLMFFMTATGRRLLLLPYAGVADDPVLLVPGITLVVAVVAMGVWWLALALYVFLCVDGDLMREHLRLNAWFRMGLLAAAVAIAGLFALSRYDYWAMTQEHIVVQLPFDKTYYALDDVHSVDTGCDMYGRKDQSSEGWYKIYIGMKAFDLMDDGNAEGSVAAIEWLQRRPARYDDTVYQQIPGDPRCVYGLAARLKGDGVRRLANIGIVEKK